MKRWQKYLEQNGTSSGVLAMLAALDHIEETEPQVVKSIEQELADQRSYLKLIASENYTSLAVQLAMGNLLTDKYAEGFAHHRFYAGCDNVDAVEDLAEQELLKLFGADAAYVQPHSGADANLVAFFAILSKHIELPDLSSLSNAEWAKLRGRLVNQKMMGMSLDSGGHLTHGFRHNISGKLFESIPYSVDPKTGLLDYAALEKHVLEEKPLFLMAGYSAYPRRLNFAKMREIADRAGSVLLVDMAHFSGLVAGGVFTGEENPIPYAHIVTSTTHKTLRGPRGGIILCQKEYADVVKRGCPLVLGGPLPHVIAAKAVAFKEARTPSFKTYAAQIVANARALAEGLTARGARVLTGGTDNHIVMLDVTGYGLTGRQAENALREGHLTVNRNSIPQDPNGAWYTSGIRLGTPAITTLGMKEEQMDFIANAINQLLKHTTAATSSQAKYTLDKGVKETVAKEMQALLSTFPLYPEIPIV